MPAKLKMSQPEYYYMDKEKINIHNDKEKSVKVIAGKFESTEGLFEQHNVEPIYFDINLNKNSLSFSALIRRLLPCFNNIKFESFVFS